MDVQIDKNEFCSGCGSEVTPGSIKFCDCCGEEICDCCKSENGPHLVFAENGPYLVSDLCTDCGGSSE